MRTNLWRRSVPSAMELSPDEYGRYWRGSIRIAAGGLTVGAGYRFVRPLLDHPRVLTTLFGATVLALIALVGTFVAVLGLARVIRTAVRAER